MGAVKGLQAMDDDELYVYAKEIRAPIELVRQVRNALQLAGCTDNCSSYSIDCSALRTSLSLCHNHLP